MVRRFHRLWRLRTAAGVLLLIVLFPPAPTVSTAFGKDGATAPAVPAQGSRGWGLTVYHGSHLDRFEVEILGRLEKAGSTGDLILARLSGSPLDETGVLQGMSGSPVWVDGELVGAVAATWPFAVEAVAVIRPIAEMKRLGRYLRDGGHPTWAPGATLAPAPQSLALPWALTLGWDPAETVEGMGDRTATEGSKGLDAIFPAGVGASRLRLWPEGLGRGLVFSAAGMDGEVLQALQQRIGSPLVPGMAGPSSAHPAGVAAKASGGKDRGGRDSQGKELDAAGLREGDAVAVVLIRGDAQLAATGTVTEVDEEGTVLAFGHPLLAAGPVSLPLYRAEIIGVMPSRQVSFKFATATEEVGAMLVDSPVGIAGRLGVRADTLPVEVQVQGEGASHSFHFEVARHPVLSPPLVYWCVQNSLMIGQDLGSVATARADIELTLADGPPLRTRVALTGLQVGGPLAQEIMLPLNLLAFNPGEAVRVEAVKVELDLRGEIQSAQLGRVRVRPAAPRAGDTLQVGVEILPFRDAPRWVELSLPLPEDLPDGPYILHLSDGGRAFATELERAQARWAYPGLRQIREAFAQRRSAETLSAVLYGRSAAAVVRGSEWRRLPPSVRGIVGRGRGGAAAASVEAEVCARAETATSWVLDGEQVLTLEVGGKRDEGESPSSGRQ